MPHIEDGTLHTYLDGECRPAEREAVESHLSVCEACRARLSEARSEIESASGLLSQLEPGPVQGPTWPELEERAAARAGAGGRDTAGGRRRGWGPGLAWAASVMIAFGAGWLAHSEGLVPVRSTADGAAEAQPMETLPMQARLTEARPTAGSAEAGGAAPAEEALESKGAAPDRAPVSKGRTLANEAGDAASAKPSGAAAREKAATRDEPTEPAGPPVVSRGETPPPGVMPKLEASRTSARADSGAALTEREQQMIDRDLQRIAGERRGAVPKAIRSGLPVSEPMASQEGDLSGGFFAVGADGARNWLGAPLRTIPDLHLQSVEVGPATAVEGGISGRPAIRLVYADATGHVIALTQQFGPTTTAPDESAREPTLVVSPSGLNVYRWSEGGYRLSLSGVLSGDSLKALADRVR